MFIIINSAQHSITSTTNPTDCIPSAYVCAVSEEELRAKFPLYTQDRNGVSSDSTDLDSPIGSPESFSRARVCEGPKTPKKKQRCSHRESSSSAQSAENPYINNCQDCKNDPNSDPHYTPTKTHFTPKSKPYESRIHMKDGFAKYYPGCHKTETKPRYPNPDYVRTYLQSEGLSFAEIRTLGEVHHLLPQCLANGWFTDDLGHSILPKQCVHFFQNLIGILQTKTREHRTIIHKKLNKVFEHHCISADGEKRGNMSFRQLVSHVIRILKDPELKGILIHNPYEYKGIASSLNDLTPIERQACNPTKQEVDDFMEPFQAYLV